MKADLIIHNIKTLYNPNQEPPVKGLKMSQIEQIDHAFIAIKKGVILHVGQHHFEQYRDSNTQLYDAKQTIAVPGFIDPHTHLVHAGSREYEYEKIQKGTPYLDILKQGGGILGTVLKTKEASETSLYDQALVSLNRMLCQGVTAIEAKSGYGLDLDTEIKQLVVAKKLNENHPIEIVSTYLGAHAIPKNYQDNPQDFVTKIIDDLKEIKKRDLAEAVDVFCETGVFSIEDTRKILTEAKKLGFLVKLHADEIHALGGAGLGVELHAVSADHLMAIKDTDILLLAQSNTVANLLPGTSFFLKKGYAPARKMIDQGCAVSISTDYNPGSSPSEAFQLMMQIAFIKLNMTPEEILNATTLNPAYQLKRHHEMGSIQVGKKANIVLLNVPNLTYMLYHYGICHTQDVFIDGKLVFQSK
jgi:imidazolonepropionase